MLGASAGGRCPGSVGNGGCGTSNFDAVLFVGGQGPMYTFFADDRVPKLAAEFYEADKITAVICTKRHDEQMR